LADPTITVNGEQRPLDGVPAWVSTLDWLRGIGLTGAKEGCAEGECGACSVMVARPDGERSRWTAINACLVPALALDGQEVVTSEGLGTPDDLHPVQREMAERGGSQCGYCTPGFVCSMAAEYYRPDRSEAEGFDLHAIAGNLCRCTGYRPIRDAAQALTAPPADDPLAGRVARPAPAPAATRADGFARPADLPEAFEVLSEHPDATVLAGGTDWGVEVNLRGERPAYVVAVDRLPELREFEVTDRGIEIGAALTLSEVEAALAGRLPMLDEVCELFASRLIRNGATIGGNLATASPIGDLAPALMALEAGVVLASAEGSREVPIADYFTGYRQTVRRADELIRAVRVPLPTAGITAFHKIAKRHFDDISSVAVGFAIELAEGSVKSARIGLGGVAATPMRALATEAALEGRPWDEQTVREAAGVLRGEGTPMDDHRASAAYRSAMLGTSLLKLWEATR
jgi:xanthine dehydrogenase small subunit